MAPIEWDDEVEVGVERPGLDSASLTPFFFLSTTLTVLPVFKVAKLSKNFGILIVNKISILSESCWKIKLEVILGHWQFYNSFQLNIIIHKYCHTLK